jgi:hypothetical protein
MAGVHLGANAFGLVWNKPAFSAGYMGFETLRGVGLAVIAAFVLRAVIPQPTGRWPLGRSLAGFVGLATLAYLVALAVSVAMVVPDTGRAVPPLSVALGHLALAVAGLAFFLVAAFIMVRLVLWPVALLLGAPPIAPQRSWRLMRRATGGVFGANVISLCLFALPVVVVEALLGVKLGVHPTAFAAITSVVVATLDVYSYAVVAAVYRARVFGDQWT